jgi:NAD(P)-dependent dehydrogenase (short-subunit alcohol dehydrogenase family)
MPQTVLRNSQYLTMDESATYVIAGGLGGLGRNVARWLVDRGARNLILLSRSGVHTNSTHAFVEELKAQGTVVKAPPCDVTNAKSLEQVLEECTRDMPPIKGCVQGSMVLRVSDFQSSMLSTRH